MEAINDERPATRFGVDLHGQVAIVTGASSGLGERCARVLAACGAKVAVAARRKDRLDALVADIAAQGGTAAAFAVDMRDAVALVDLVAQAQATLGPVTILVNNAGIADGKRAVNVPVALVDDLLGTNVRGPYILACEVARRLIASDMPGRIVNISSIGAYTCSKPGQALYSISKAALNRMTEVLAVEWSAHFINVNAIAPGSFRSAMTARMIERLGDPSPGLPRRRLGGPDQLDSTLLYLVSPASDAVTGTIIKVDDGQLGR